jgi:hypothetical protein
MNVQTIDTIFAGAFPLGIVDEPIKISVDFPGGTRNRWVGGEPLEEFLKNLGTCLDELGKWDLIPRAKLSTVQDVKPFCERIRAFFRSLDDGANVMGNDIKLLDRCVEGLDYILNAPDTVEDPDTDLTLRVRMVGPLARVKSLVGNILELKRNSEAAWLAELAKTQDVRISRSVRDEVVIIRNGIAERTGLAVTQEIECALADNLLSNAEGRKVATRWVASDW